MYTNPWLLTRKLVFMYEKSHKRCVEMKKILISNQNMLSHLFSILHSLIDISVICYLFWLIMDQDLNPRFFLESHMNLYFYVFGLVTFSFPSKCQDHCKFIEPMFYLEKGDSSSYEELIVDTKKFYRKKVKEQPRKRRYSDQFKDPLFIEKDIHRKLKMIERFRQNEGDIDDKINKYTECIEKCIYILNSELEIPIKMIFDIFNLTKYGFKLDDFGIEEESNEQNVEED